MNDEIRMNSSVFLRLMELAREDICNDADLHDIAEVVLEISQHKQVDMSDYQTILDYKDGQNISDCDVDADEQDDDDNYLSRIRQMIKY